MTRTGPSKKAGSADASGRLAKAQAYRKAARQGLQSLGVAEIADPIVSNIVLSAIGYADAVTARYVGKINRKDHAALIALLRDALGKRFPQEQGTRLTRILNSKDEAQYGAAVKRKEEAEKLFGDLEKFAAWAETILRG